MAIKEINEISNAAVDINDTDNIALQTATDITKKCTITILSEGIATDIEDRTNTFSTVQKYDATAHSEISNDYASLDVPTVAWVYLTGTSLGYTHNLNGFSLKNNATFPNTHIDIGAGIASTSTLIRYSKSVDTKVKRIDQTFLAGSGNGGRAPGVSLSANTWYHVFSIMNDTTLVNDVVFDTSVTCANIPTGYDSYARVGSFKTDGSSFIKTFIFSEINGVRAFRWKTPVLDNSSTVSATAANITLSVPNDLECIADFNVSLKVEEVGDKEVIVYISNSNLDDLAPSSTVAPLGQVRGVYSKTNTYAVSPVSNMQLNTDSSGQIRVRASDTGGTLYVATLGWVDPGNKIFY